MSVKSLLLAALRGRERRQDEYEKSLSRQLAQVEERIYEFKRYAGTVPEHLLKRRAELNTRLAGYYVGQGIATTPRCLLFREHDRRFR